MDFQPSVDTPKFNLIPCKFVPSSTVMFVLLFPSAAGKSLHQLMTVNKIHNLISSLQQLNDLPRETQQKEEGNEAFDWNICCRWKHFRDEIIVLTCTSTASLDKEQVEIQITQKNCFSFIHNSWQITPTPISFFRNFFYLLFPFPLFHCCAVSPQQKILPVMPFTLPVISLLESLISTSGAQMSFRYANNRYL